MDVLKNSDLVKITQEPQWNLNKFRLSPEEVSKIKKAFDIFDTKITGYLEFKKLPLAIYYLGFDYTTDELCRLMDNIDKNKTGRIAFKDFLEFVRFKMSPIGTISEFKKAFTYFDFNRTGKISFDNFKRAAKELAVHVSDEELRELVETADIDGDGEVGWEDLMNVMKENKLI